MLVEIGVLDITFVSVVSVLFVIDFFVIVRLYFGEAESDIHTVLIEGAVVYHLTSAFAGEFLYDFLALLPPLLMFGGVDVERLLPVVEKDGPSTLQDCFQRVLANAKAFCLGVKVLGPWNRFTLLNFLQVLGETGKVRGLVKQATPEPPLSTAIFALVPK
jgi:hypothetical protein